ncbi:hypothetical protein SAQ01S_27230 [Sphingomonas aquatilis NBRC 16722]|nr:hypothetical protein SAQ01S_27230 [Sphingomonas aquatilis NBRC 16722]
MKHQALLGAVRVAAAKAVSSPVPAAKGPEDLGGVRPKGKAAGAIGGRKPHRHPRLGPGFTGPPGVD